MSNLKISIAMATYNGERFLKEQLDSFARQERLPDELVACDDGSTDCTLDILHRFTQEVPFPVRIHKNPERMGVQNNFLKAVELCVGGLVAFADQDDVWLPEKLAICAAGFESNDVTLVTHCASLVGPGLEHLGRTWPYAAKYGRQLLPPGKPLSRGYAGSAMVFRRQAVEPLLRNAQLRQAFAGHDDLVGFVTAASGIEVRLEDVLSLHRCHNKNSSASHDVAALGARDYVRRTHGMRKRLLAAACWTRTHFGLASVTGWDSYERASQELSIRANILRSVAPSVGEPLRSVLEESSGLLRKRGDALAVRSLLYQDTSPGRALARFCRMVARGFYGSRRFGGLGAWSLLKDGSLLFWPARREPIAKDPKSLIRPYL